MCIWNPLESWLPGQRLEIIYIRVYRLIYASFALNFLYGKEYETNAMLYQVYTGLYSVQISIYSYIPSIYRAVLSTNQYIQLHTDTNFIHIDATCISGHVRIWTRTRSYIRWWTLNICVQVRIYAYIRVCNICKKHAWFSDSNRESHAYCKAALTTTLPALILRWVSYDICLLDRGFR